MRRFGIAATTIFVGIFWASGVAGQSDSPGQQRRDKLEEMADEREELIDEDVDNLSGEEKLQKAEKTIDEAKAQLSDTDKLLEKAREEEEDIMKINCINDKQAAIKGFLKVSEQSYVNLKDAVDEGDQKGSNHHYTLIAIAGQKIDGLTQEARLCAGEATRYAEDTSVDVQVSGDLPDDPQYIDDDETEVTRLPELSPYQ